MGVKNVPLNHNIIVPSQTMRLVTVKDGNKASHGQTVSHDGVEVDSRKRDTLKMTPGGNTSQVSGVFFIFSFCWDLCTF